MDGELQHRLQHLGIAVDRTGGHGVEPGGDRWLVVPAEALPAEHAEGADNPNRPGGMALDDDGFEHAGQHHEVPLRPGRSVEDQPLVGALGATKEPARQPVGETTGRRHGLTAHGLAGDVELRP